MRILQVGKFYHPFLGGIETVVKSLSEGLVKRGHEVTVLCFHHTLGGWFGGSDLPEIETLHGVKIFRLKSIANIFSQPLSPQVISQMKSLAAQNDILHFHTPNPVAECSALLLDPEIPCITTFHSDIIRQKVLLPFLKPLLKNFLRQTRNIIVPTEFHLKYSPVLQEFQEKCRIIPFGLDPMKFELTPEHRQNIQNHKDKYGKFILFIGRLVPYKGLTYLLTALTDIDVTLLIIGDGVMRTSLEEQAKQMGIANRVHFLGKIQSDNNLLPYLYACEFLVLPSINRSEAFSLVLVEAMACQKPVITSRLDSGVRFVNKENFTGLMVEPENSEQLANAIHKLLSSPDLVTQMGQNARSYFLENFTLEDMITKHENLYQELLTVSSGVRPEDICKQAV